MESTLSMNIAILSTDESIVKFYDDQINTITTNSGFDLVVTEDVIFNSNKATKLVPLGIKASPLFNSGYYLYPRSSIYKTPLRMANSVGIIDMDYRGQIMAPVDFYQNLTQNNEQEYTLKKGTRLFQLCHPSLQPMKFNKVNELELDQTIRGVNGFGSTGSNVTINI